MKKQFIVCLILISLIGIVSAVYPGETITWNNDLSDANLSYHFEKNSTAIPAFNITITKTKISAKIPANMPPGNFDIVFVLNEVPKPEPNPYFGWWWFPQFHRYYFIKSFWVYPNRFYYPFFGRYY
jgi:hypothetical protein